MKSVIVIMILVGVYLFYPTYDLLVKDSPFDETFTLEGSQFLTADLRPLPPEGSALPGCATHRRRALYHPPLKSPRLAGLLLRVHLCDH